jgi:monoamine oxidase
MSSAQQPAKFNRRNAIKSLAAGTGAAALLASGPADAKKSKQSYDVLILGGGFAGVTAARELGAVGYKCLILEARNRLGGRTFTTDVFDRKSDVGGQWVHWLQPHVWAEVKRYGMDLFETPGAVSPTTVGVLDKGTLTQVAPGRSFEMIDAGMRLLFPDAGSRFPRPFDPWFNSKALEQDQWSVADRLKQIEMPDLDRTMLEAYLTTNLNGPLTDGGYLDQAHWYARAGSSMERLLQACAQFKMTAGTAGLIDRMMQDAKPDVRLNTPIASVDQDKSGVRMTAEDGTRFHAKLAVIALPMNCWADISWTPALMPEKIKASQQRHAGSGFELHVLIEGRADAYQALAATPNAINLWYTDYYHGENTIMVGLGATSTDFDFNDDAQVLAQAQKLSPGAKVLQSYAYDWNADPYSKGTWCNYKPGMWSSFGKAMQTSENKLIFAGADTADGWRGFIDGAIETGLRAARQCKSLLAKA